MKILITGYKGFIGQNITKELESAGHQIIKFDISEGLDVCKPEDLEKQEKPDLIIHLANLTFVPASYDNPLNFYSVNFNGTLNVLEFCRKNQARLIYFSSYIYGNPDYQPIDENHPKRAFNPYAQSKVICENLCEGYNRDFKVDITVFRPFNIYGPGQNKIFLIPGMIEQAQKGLIQVKNDQPKRDYIHISDIVRAVRSAVELDTEKPELRTFNLGSGLSHSVREVADMIREIFDRDIEYQCSGEMRPNEVMDTIADISKIRKVLNWEPLTELKDGLRTMIEQEKRINL